MDAPDQALRAGLIALLRADATVAGQFGTVRIDRNDVVKIFDELPQRQGLRVDAPYALVAESEVYPVDAGDCGEVFDVALTVHCWSTAVGRGECSRLTAAVRGVILRLARGLLTLPDPAWSIDRLPVDEIITRVIDDPDGRSRHGVVTFTAGLTRST
jgi:Protein of unknown function (DUF3168)